jgi:CBS domain-containing protein
VEIDSLRAPTSLGQLAALDAPGGTMTTVSELMTRKVASVRTSDTLSTAAKIMWECDCGVVPVLEADSDRVVGMITDRDICMATWSRNSPPSNVPVSEAMSKKLYACRSGDSISAAESLMRSKQVRRLPVVDAGTLVGILSLADIVLQSRATEGKGKIVPLSGDELTMTMAEICQPSHPASVS